MTGDTPLAKMAAGNAKKLKKTTYTDTTQTQALTPWSQNQYDTQTAGILDTVNRYNEESPFQAYTGQMVAGLSGNEQRAREVANSSVGQNEGILGDSANLIRRASETNWTPEQVAGPREVERPDEVSYRTFEDFNPETYYNPFEDEVVDASGAFFDEQLARQTSENQSRATQNGAYGGSRHGVVDAELQRTSQMDRAQMMADLRYRGYEGARDQFNSDSANMYGADVYNSRAGYETDVRNSDSDYMGRQNQATRNDAAAQSNRDNMYRGAAEYQDLAAFRTADSGAQVQMLESLGATEREIEQAQLDADRAEFDREAADRLQRFLTELQTRQGILSSTPMLTTTTGHGEQYAQGLDSTDVSNWMSGIGSIMGGVGGMVGGKG